MKKVVQELGFIQPISKDDDATLIQKVCSQTLEPAVCIDCINSDTSRVTDDIPELTHSIVFCAWSEAVFAQEDAEQLAQNTTEPKLKEALQACDALLFSVQNDLGDALMQLEARDYDNVMISLTDARIDVFDSVNQFGYGIDILIPPKLLDGMVRVKHLNDVAAVLLNLLL
ncbi:hypothetical protein HHK36_008858 [Tetracentron sinense]|uniref:Pectinesterase inhibitor domain-containing protein n=1 Tax=Tetracentron sinense TaxID=13715 RepID=A0A834ZH32_TETSI|nr:hypothetical protein HHK36_008858 [Tetracentron sinense]